MDEIVYCESTDPPSESLNFAVVGFGGFKSRYKVLISRTRHGWPEAFFHYVCRGGRDLTLVIGVGHAPVRK